MPPRRSQVVARVAQLVGSDLLQITDPQSGWPALGRLVVEGNSIEVALFVAPVGLTGRGRDEVERRFQNALNHPMSVEGGRRPLLLGLWESDRLLTVTRPLLVSADPIKRLGQTTRVSVFVSTGALVAAEERGWSEYAASRGELIRCFLPPLLPLSASADWSGVALPSPSVQTTIEAAGLEEASLDALPSVFERTRRVGSALVRDARFSKSVVEAYNGLCAMCGLDLQLVQGAHIYPVSAPGAVDAVWNGLSLCGNHHLAFDRHLIGVQPDSREVHFHPIVTDQFADNDAIRGLVDGTFTRLVEPNHPASRPRSEMFVARYHYFEGLYEWMRKSRH